METATLIETLSADTGATRPRMALVWSLGLAAALIAAAAGFHLLLDIRPDMPEALKSSRFLYKFVVTGSLLAVTLVLLPRFARPLGRHPGGLALLAIPPLLVAIGIAAELIALPGDRWYGEAMGENALWCMALIPLIALAPAAIMFAVFRRGAPTLPRLTGAMIGLFSGALAASFYAAHCTNDSPLFVGIWYAIGIGATTGVTTLVGDRLLRW